MPLFLNMAWRQIRARKRQSLVSLLGIVVGVSLFLAISSLMQGSQKDFIKRLVDNAPHITISDSYRYPARQPLAMLHGKGALEIRSIKPPTETRGIRNYRRVIEHVKSYPGIQVSPVLSGQGLVSFAGRDVNVTLNGMIPGEIARITTIDDHMVKGSLDNLVKNRNGIIVGAELARKMALDIGDNITLATAAGEVHIFKIVGIFRVGRSDFDEGQVFADLKRVQALLNRPDRVNSIIIKLDDPYQSRVVAARIEDRIRYKTTSWQELNEDLLNTLVIRNVIMYSVVSAVLLVAGFGIYNIISTVVMEKRKDIAILKSIGFRSRDIRQIFVLQGLILGIAGIVAGIPAGMLLMVGLSRIKFHPPGIDALQMPMDWGALQFLTASAFALCAALLAAWLPARKGAAVMPVDILRGLQ